MKKIALISILVLISAGILHLGFIGFADEKEINSENITIQPKRRDIGFSVLATGIIKPQIGAEVKVGAQVSGVVKKLYVEIGAVVKKGSKLAEIDPNPFIAKVDQARAVHELAEIDKNYLKKELDRMTELKKVNLISEQEFEGYSKKYEMAAAKVKQAEADLMYTKLQFGYTKITSPVNGVVASVSTQEGETVAASFTSPTFVTVIDLSRLEVWAYVDETDIGRIEENQLVTFTVDTYPNNEIKGRVETIYPKAEIQNNVVNYITVIKIENNNEKKLRPEMTATVNINIDKKENVLTLPKKYVKRENGKKYVMILNNGKSEKVEIKTGLSDNKFYEIVEGITGREQILINKIDN